MCSLNTGFYEEGYKASAINYPKNLIDKFPDMKEEDASEMTSGVLTVEDVNQLQQGKSIN